MNRIHPISRLQPLPAVAGSILAKGARLDNLRSATAAAQEIFDIIMKNDTFEY